MRKIPTLFVRDMANRGQITREHNPTVGWVLAGEGVATRKYDGIAALVSGGRLYRRRTWKPGQAVPRGFTEMDRDPETNISVGWVPVADEPSDRWFHDALKEYPLHLLAEGTYELIGPKVQGNPEHTDLHELIAHSEAQRYEHVPVDYVGLREWLAVHDVEGLVWHHEDGRMAKIKGKDFGLKRIGGWPVHSGGAQVLRNDLGGKGS